MAKVGDLIRIDYMAGEENYWGREGTITCIDDAGQLHGTWGGLAVVPGEDNFTVLGANASQYFLTKRTTN